MQNLEDLSTGYNLLSQSFPSKLLRHVHLYPFSSGKQVPPFLHGFGMQYCRAEVKRKQLLSIGRHWTII